MKKKYSFREEDIPGVDQVTLEVYPKKEGALISAEGTMGKIEIYIPEKHRAKFARVLLGKDSKEG